MVIFLCERNKPIKFVETFNVAILKKVGESFFKKMAWLTLIGLILLSVFIGLGVRNLKMDYDFEKFFPEKDEETAFFNEHRKKFESDNDFLLISIEHKNGVFDLQFLTKVQELTTEIEQKSPYIQFVTSITSQQEQFLFQGGATSSRPLIDFVKPDLKRDSINIYKKQELINTLIAKDAKSVCIYVRHDDYLSKKKSDELIEDILKRIERFNFDDVHVGGRTIGQKFYLEIMLFELWFFIGLSVIMIILFLFFTFRSGWGIVIPQIVILMATLWVVGMMGWFNQPMNIILTTLPTIMFVVAMSDVIHVASRYLDALREGHSKFESIKITYSEVGFSIFLTSLTTAIGFLSLYFVNVQPIKIFGIVMGIGVMIAFILTFILLPVLFYIFPSPGYVYKTKDRIFWKKNLKIWFFRILRKRKLILAIYAVFTLICVGGMMLIKADNYLMDDLSENEPLKKDFNYLDAHYGGVRPFEMAVIVKDSTLNVWSPEVISEVNKVEEYLTNEYGITVKLSLISTLKVLNRSSHLGNVKYYKIPESNREIRQFRRIIRTIDGGKFSRAIIDSTEMQMRINGTIGDIGNLAVTEKNKALYEFLDNLESKAKIEFKLTGTAHLLDKNLRYLSISLIKGLTLSILLIALIMGLVYKSFSMMIISIIPNIIPLLAIAAFMGFTGINLKTSTSIIFTISFGIAVDDTIHLLGKFKFELMQGNSKVRALKNAYLTTGKAMVLTTLILCSGFLLLVFSSFMGTLYIGILLCLTLIIALIADLTLLPVLIYLFYNPGKIKEKIKK